MNSDNQPAALSQSILVVDDEPQVCEILSDVLAASGHKVDTVADGLDAVEKLKAVKYSIVITDMDMPRMDGMALIEHIIANHKGIDIVAITGHIMRYKYTDVVSAGAADFIAKPFTLNELEAKLNRIIRERSLREQLEKLAVLDPLTGLSNRRSFEENVRREAIRSIRYGHPLFVFFVDVDHFKEYNDLYGHQMGDKLLVEAAGVLKNSIREEVDGAYRYGGDEFLILLPHLPATKAFLVAERIRGKYNERKLDPTSLSIGIAQFLERFDTIELDIEDMIKRSDEALYFAKKKCGRNAVFIDALSQ